MRPLARTVALAEVSASACHIGAIIPAFNESKTIAGLVEKTAGAVRSVIVVDDGSTDGTAALVNGPGVRIVRHPYNRGKGESLLSGIEAAREAGCDFVVTLDADGQHRPENIPDLLRHAGRDTLVVGSRMSEVHRIPKARYRANQTANFFISWAAGQWIPDTQCGFRVYPMNLFEKIHLRRNRRYGFVFESEVLIEACRAGFQVKAVPIPALYGTVLQRPSHFRPVPDVTAIVLMVTGKILTRWFCLPSLIRSWRARRAQIPC